MTYFISKKDFPELREALEKFRLQSEILAHMTHAQITQHLLNKRATIGISERKNMAGPQSFMAYTNHHQTT